MNIKYLEIPGALLIKPKVFLDPRGYFFETFSCERYYEAGLKDSFLQENASFSSRGVLRGLHFQKKFPQGKLVSVLVGKVYDVIVDLRYESITFGKHIGVWLDDELHEQLYVPPGCAHGFYVASKHALFHYKCTQYYHPEDEAGVMWNDPAFGIEWPLLDSPSLSKKDQEYPLFEKENFM